MTHSSTLAEKHGRRWESYVKKECRQLRKANNALVRKNWRAPEVPRKGVDARIAPSKPDFSGVLPSGRHVVFEAKATVSEMSLDFGRIAEHQWAHLDEAHALGALSFVYMLDGKMRKWVVPWGHVLEVNQERNSYPFGTYPAEQKEEGETWLETVERLGLLDGGHP